VTAALRSLVLTAALCAGAGCFRYPQRWPGPLPLAEEPVEAVVTGSPPPRAATVQRDSDPVWVRRPGARDDFALPFYDKREHLEVGALVRTGAGGRAELLWTPDATSLVLFDEGRVTLGDPERDEPLVRMHSVTRAILTVTPEDRIELPGGARLRGDPAQPTGPIVLEATRDQAVRVTNQSKSLMEIRYRDASLELAPGESIDLPRLATGTAPREPGPEPVVYPVGSFFVSGTGRIERGEEPGAFRALEPSHLTALGVAVALESGQTARFSGLSQVAPAPPADAGPAPEGDR
jgi:hypothetical protein